MELAKTDRDLNAAPPLTRSPLGTIHVGTFGIKFNSDLNTAHPEVRINRTFGLRVFGLSGLY